MNGSPADTLPADQGLLGLRCSAMQFGSSSAELAEAIAPFNRTLYGHFPGE